MKARTVKRNEIKVNPNNPRTIKDEKFKKLIKSVEDLPEMLEMRPIIVDEDMIILGGNMRYQACVRAGLQEIPIIQYTRADHEKTIAAQKGKTYEEVCKEIVIKDNVAFGEWDWDLLSNEWSSVEITDWGLDVWQNEDDVIEAQQEEIYTKNIEAPTYEPTNEKPKLQELYDTTKADQLINQINRSKIPKADKEFLIEAAKRHTVFNYRNIADYYANSNKEVQELMENSALVIIDFHKAIANGYVKLTKEIEEQYTSEYGM